MLPHIASPLHPSPIHLELAVDTGTWALFFSWGSTHSKLSIFISALSSCPEPKTVLANKQEDILIFYLLGSFPNILPMSWVLWLPSRVGSWNSKTKTLHIFTLYFDVSFLPWVFWKGPEGQRKEKVSVNISKL